MNSIILSVIFAAFWILIAAVISSAIKYEGGANPKDPAKRKMWFWIIAILNPIMWLFVGVFLIAPNPDNDQMVYDDFMSLLPITAGIGFVVYVVLGFVLSKVFKNGKIGNWF